MNAELTEVHLSTAFKEISNKSLAKIKLKEKVSDHTQQRIGYKSSSEKALNNYNPHEQQQKQKRYKNLFSRVLHKNIQNEQFLKKFTRHAKENRAWIICRKKINRKCP